MTAVIRDRATDQGLRRPSRDHRARPRGRRGRDLRVPRAQRRRQDDDDAGPARPHPADVRTGRGVRHRDHRRSGRDPPADRLPARRVRPVRPADRRPDDHLLREPPRRRRPGVRRGARRAPGPRPEPPLQGVLEGQQAEGRADRRAPAPARPADPGRADVRARSARPADVLRHRPRGARGRGPDDLPVEPHHRRGRPDLRPGGDHPRGPAGPGRLDRGHPPARLPPRRADFGAPVAPAIFDAIPGVQDVVATGDTVRCGSTARSGRHRGRCAARPGGRRQPRAEPRGRLPRPVRRAPGRPASGRRRDHDRRRADAQPARAVVAGRRARHDLRQDRPRQPAGGGGRRRRRRAVHVRHRRAVRVRPGVLDGRAPAGRSSPA